MLPYEVLDEKKVPYRVRQRVSDHLFVPHLIAQSPSATWPCTGTRWD